MYVVDLHIQRIVLATEEIRVAQRVSHRPIIKCLFRSRPQRGTKVNGSHHGDNLLLRPNRDPNRDKIFARSNQPRAVTDLCGHDSLQSMCVCFLPVYKFVGRTSRGHIRGKSHRIFHPPSFCGACLNFSREKDSAIPFPRRP